jgi:ketosteroid isomerase-like protein
VHLDRIIEAEDHLIARLHNTARRASDGRSVEFDNLWLFTIAQGRIASVELFADTAASHPASHPAGH